MRTIRVTGKGQLKLRPDTTRITITLTGINPEYSETLRRSSEDTEVLKEALLPFGFSGAELKTLNFSVDTEFESYKDHGAYRQRLAGYRYRHILKVEFPSDNRRLGKILYALAKCPVNPEFRISYTLADPEAAKSELLATAVTDAQRKAAVLTSAAGLKLGEIQSMDYSWGQVDFVVNSINRDLAMEECAVADGGSFDLNVEPDDIEASDTVTVVWEIA